MAQLMQLPLTVSCFSKIHIGFTFLVPAHPGSPRKKAVKRVCVSVCVCVSGHLLEWVLPLGVLSALYTTMSLLFCCCYSVSTNKLKLIDWSFESCWRVHWAVVNNGLCVCWMLADVGRRFCVGVQKSQERSSEEFLHHLAATSKRYSSSAVKRWLARWAGRCCI